MLAVVGKCETSKYTIISSPSKHREMAPRYHGVAQHYHFCFAVDKCGLRWNYKVAMCIPTPPCHHVCDNWSCSKTQSELQVSCTSACGVCRTRCRYNSMSLCITAALSSIGLKMSTAVCGRVPKLYRVTHHVGKNPRPPCCLMAGGCNAQGCCCSSCCSQNMYIAKLAQGATTPLHPSVTAATVGNMSPASRTAPLSDG